MASAMTGLAAESVRYVLRVIEPGVSKISSPSGSHGSEGYRAAWCRLTDAPGRSAEAETRKPGKRGLDIDEK
jgi:hypothetical protein